MPPASNAGVHDFAGLNQATTAATVELGEEFRIVANCCRHLVIPELREVLSALERLAIRTDELTKRGEAPCRLESPEPG